MTEPIRWMLVETGAGAGGFEAMRAIPAAALASLAPCPRCLLRDHIVVGWDSEAWIIQCSRPGCCGETDSLSGTSPDQATALQEWNSKAKDWALSHYWEYNAPPIIREWFAKLLLENMQLLLSKVRDGTGDVTLLSRALEAAWSDGAHVALHSSRAGDDDAIIFARNPHKKMQLGL